MLSIKQQDWKNFFKGDAQIWTILFLLSALSIPVVYSSINGLAEISDSSHFVFLTSHLRNISIGIIAAFIAYMIPTRWYNIGAVGFWVFTIVLLAYTSYFAEELNGAKRWIEMPIIGWNLQPSDLAKLSLIILAAQRISALQHSIKNFREILKPLVLPICLTLFFIAPNDLSTALLLFITLFLMMFVGRMDIRLVAGTVTIGIIFLGSLYAAGIMYPDNNIRSGTWTTRILDFIDDKPDFQVDMREQAISNGGLLGVGPGKSLNKNYYNSPYTDFIFAVICEEFGLLGGLAVIALYLWFFWRILLLVIQGDRAFATMLAFGLGAVIVIQALLNIMVTLNMLPSTGLPLPMLSRGGTSNVITGIAFGIILGISRELSKKSVSQSIDTDESDI